MNQYKPLRPHADTPKGTLLDPAFRYVPAASTDVAKTFARVRLEREKKRGENGGAT